MIFSRKWIEPRPDPTPNRKGRPLSTPIGGFVDLATAYFPLHVLDLSTPWSHVATLVAGKKSIAQIGG